MAHSLFKKSQAAAVLEPNEGTTVAFSDSDRIPVLETPSVAPETQMIERNLALGTLTKPVGLKGLSSGQLNISMELAGPNDGAPTTEPPCSLLLQACGRKVVPCRLYLIDADWGAGGKFMLHGVTVTFDNSGATARLLSDTLEGDTYCYLEILTGSPTALDSTITDGATSTATLSNDGVTFSEAVYYEKTDDPLSTLPIGAITNGPIEDGDEIVGSTTGARGRAVLTASTSGPETILIRRFENGAHFTGTEAITVTGKPTLTGAITASESQSIIPSLTVGSLHDTERRLLSGARGTFSVAGENGDRALITFEFMGKLEDPSALANLAAPSVDDTAIPPVVHGGNYEWIRLHDVNSARWNPQFRNWQFDMRNDVQMIDDPNDATGIQSYAIVGRQPGGSLDPLLPPPSVFPVTQYSKDKTAFHTRMRIGAGLNDGNTFEFRADRTQIESAPLEGRSEVTVARLGLTHRGITNDEMHIFRW